MRKYRVIVTPEAEADIREALSYLEARSESNAKRWLQGLHRLITTLERSPERCAFAREREYFGEDLRQLVHHSHRIVFQVDPAASCVMVLFVRHASRTTFGESSALET